MLVSLSLFRLKLLPLLVFLFTALPTTIDKKTTQEVWSGTPVSFSDLKKFGCPAYAHVDNENLEPRSIYMSGVKGYKL